MDGQADGPGENPARTASAAEGYCLLGCYSPVDWVDGCELVLPAPALHFHFMNLATYPNERRCLVVPVEAGEGTIGSRFQVTSTVRYEVLESGCGPTLMFKETVTVAVYGRRDGGSDVQLIATRPEDGQGSAP
jgi:hypothetical protein